MLEDTLKQIDQAYKDGIINDYAIGAGVASIFYLEPYDTKDLDIYTFLPVSPSGLISLEKIYNYFLNKGYETEGQFIRIEGVDVEFLPPRNELEREAIENAIEMSFGNIKVKVFAPEYLMAISLFDGDFKRMARLQMFLEQSEFNQDKLVEILKSHNLYQKWVSFLMDNKK